MQSYAIRRRRMPRYEAVVQASSRMRVIAYAAFRGTADGPDWGGDGVIVLK